MSAVASLRRAPGAQQARAVQVRGEVAVAEAEPGGLAEARHRARARGTSRPRSPQPRALSRGRPGHSRRCRGRARRGAPRSPRRRPVLPMMVRSPRIHERARPRSSLAAPVPPASATIFMAPAAAGGAVAAAAALRAPPRSRARCRRATRTGRRRAGRGAGGELPLRDRDEPEADPYSIEALRAREHRVDPARGGLLERVGEELRRRRRAAGASPSHGGRRRSARAPAARAPPRPDRGACAERARSLHEQGADEAIAAHAPQPESTATSGGAHAPTKLNSAPASTSGRLEAAGT